MHLNLYNNKTDAPISSKDTQTQEMTILSEKSGEQVDVKQFNQYIFHQYTHIINSLAVVLE